MRIAYVSNYIGESFISKHASSASFSISGTLKTHGIAQTLLSNGHEVSVFSTGITNCNKYINSFSELIKTNFGNYNVYYSKIFSFKKCSPINAFFLLLKLINNKSKYDAVIYYNINENSIVSILAFKDKSKILEYEDNIFNRSTIKKPKKISLFFKKIISNFVINSSDKAIVVSKNMIDKNKIKNQFHFPGFISSTFLESNRNNKIIAKKDNYVPFQIYIAGGAHYSKGFDILLDALEYLPHIRIEVHLYSNTILDSNNLKKIKTLKTNKQIFVHKFVNQEYLAKIFIEKANVLLNTTRNMNMPKFTAGFPFKMLEYASTGIPIISSEIGKLENKFDKNICFYENDCPINLSKSIEEVFKNYNSYQKKARNLSSYVNKFYTLDAISQRIEPFLKKC